MQIRSFPEFEVPPDLRIQVLALHEQAWPSDDTTGTGGAHDPALNPLSMMLVADGRVLAALDILSKDITHHGERYAASGLSAVVTDRAQRGKGCGSALVLAAREKMRASGVDLGIFTCDLPLQGFYERAGWHALVDALIVGGTPESPFPSDQFDKVTMAELFSAKAKRNAKTFSHCRIELYPGEIDRLW